MRSEVGGRWRFLRGIRGALLLAAFACSPAEPEADVVFRWAFAALVGPPGEERLIPLAGERALQSGNRLKMLVAPVSACWIYVIHRDPDGEIQLVFPGAAQRGAALERSRVYELPEGPHWFVLDQRTGRETYHLLASAERLVELETLLEQHAAASGEPRRALAARVGEEIAALTLRHAELARPAQRPASIAGSIRGGGEDWREQLRGMAVEFSGRGFLSRTFVVDHR